MASDHFSIGPVATLIEPVKAGELNKALLAAKRERAATMRRKS